MFLPVEVPGFPKMARSTSLSASVDLRKRDTSLPNMAAESLCARDREILESVFNPSLTFGFEQKSTETQITETIANGHGEIDTESENKAHEFEILAVRKAEDGDIETAIELMNEAAMCSPNSASVYNNRAQIFLLKGDKNAASSDLEKALELCECRGKVAGQAFTQQGLIHRLNGDHKAALEDFQKAAELGNLFAKSQVAESNPYAALCNQMLAQAIEKLRTGEDH